MMRRYLLAFGILVSVVALTPGCSDTKFGLELDFEEDGFIPDIVIDLDFEKIEDVKIVKNVESVEGKVNKVVMTDNDNTNVDFAYTEAGS